MPYISLVQPVGFSSSKCGYCKIGKGSSYGLWAHQANGESYESMVNHGWRRSGSYIYKPDTTENSCCAQFTIKLSVNEFIPSKSQRKVISTFNEFIMHGSNKPGFGLIIEESELTEVLSNKELKIKGKGKNSKIPSSFIDSIHESEWSQNPRPPFKPFKHKFEFSLESSAYSLEKYELYEKYQIKIHSESASKQTKSGFKKFLCDNPFDDETAQHGMYRLDNKLIAFSIIDNLPESVSSVYFIWDPDYFGLSLGKYAALREIACAQERKVKDYHLGLIIVDCEKMKYKSTYSPSFLLDPATNQYFPYDYCKKLLDQNPHSSFSNPIPTTTKKLKIDKIKIDTTLEEDQDDDFYPSPPPPGFLDPTALAQQLILRTLALYDSDGTVIPYIYSKAYFNKEETQSRKCIAALGSVLEESMIALLLKD